MEVAAIEAYKTALKSIRLKCLDCASTSNEVKECNFKECSLHMLRFGKNVPKGTSRLKAIRKKCICCMNGMRKEIKHCTAPNCSLYPFRFGKNPKLAGRRFRQATPSSKYAVEFNRGVAGS